MHSTSIFQLILTVIVNAHVSNVYGRIPSTFTRESLILGWEEALQVKPYNRYKRFSPAGLIIPDKKGCLDLATSSLSCPTFRHPNRSPASLTNELLPSTPSDRHITSNRVLQVYPKKAERYVVVFKNGNHLESFEFKGPPTRRTFQEIQTRKQRGKSAWLFQEIDPNKKEWDLEKVERVGYKLPTLSEEIKQTIFTKGTEELNIVSTVGLKKVTKPASSPTDKPLDTEGITKAYTEAEGTRLIISDYDGTLREFVDDPEAATPSLELLSDLRTLSSNKDNMVWLVSGRDERFLNQHFGDIQNLGLKAAYGAATRDPISEKWLKMKFDKTSLDSIREILEVWSSSVTHSHVEEKDFGLAYHYRAAHTQDRLNQEKMTQDATQAKKDIDLIYKSEAEFLKAFLDQHVEKRGLELVTILGNMVVEVKSKKLSKREAVQSLYNNIPHPDFVLVGGDDPADEVMFQAAHDKEEDAKKTTQGDVKPPVVVTVHVSHDKGQETSAKYMVREPKEFRELLSKMSASEEKELHSVSEKKELPLAPEEKETHLLSS